MKSFPYGLFDSERPSCGIESAIHYLYNLENRCQWFWLCSYFPMTDGQVSLVENFFWSTSLDEHLAQKKSQYGFRSIIKKEKIGLSFQDSSGPYDSNIMFSHQVLDVPLACIQVSSPSIENLNLGLLMFVSLFSDCCLCLVNYHLVFSVNHFESGRVELKMWRYYNWFRMGWFRTGIWVILIGMECKLWKINKKLK